MTINDILAIENIDGQTSTRRNYRYRLNHFIAWLDDNRLRWPEVTSETLEQYAHFLKHEKGLVPSSIANHLSTVRSRYAELAADGIIVWLDNRWVTVAELEQALGKTLHSAPDLALTVARRTLNPKKPTANAESARPAEQPLKQRPSVRQRLTPEQAIALLHSPGIDALQGLRDTALIALMLCLGLRESEVRLLDVPDLSYPLDDGSLALRVPARGKNPERLIPYGDNILAREITLHWLNRANIREGAVFRGLNEEREPVRQTRIGLRSVGYILSRYRVEVDGEPMKVTSLILRRTYARRLYEMHVPLEAIQQYLGLSNKDSVLNYIGPIDDGGETLPPVLYSGFLEDFLQSRRYPFE